MLWAKTVFNIFFSNLHLYRTTSNLLHTPNVMYRMRDGSFSFGFDVNRFNVGEVNVPQTSFICELHVNFTFW